MDEIWQVLHRRDRVSQAEAIEIVRDAKSEWESMLELDPDIGYIELEDFIGNEFGLEPDYIMDFLTNRLY